MCMQDAGEMRCQKRLNNFPHMNPQISPANAFFPYMYVLEVCVDKESTTAV